ncbi:hypothetical protein [Nocardia sp. NPDC050175]|uniref:hypothetical protein n=1 Tax=Nocardia sp. NPDC050175 TaxID=3364317 RepID=UPI0037AB2288
MVVGETDTVGRGLVVGVGVVTQGSEIGDGQGDGDGDGDGDGQKVTHGTGVRPPISIVTSIDTSIFGGGVVYEEVGTSVV